MTRIRSKVNYAILVALIAFALLPARTVRAGNNWSVGAIVGLCAGTEIRQGSGYVYGVHTIVPDNNWPVKVINGPRFADGQTWWDISRREIDGGGTGWVAQSQADRCFSSPPPAPPPPAPPPPAPPPPPPPPPNDPPAFNCVSKQFQPPNWRVGPFPKTDVEWIEYRAGGAGGFYCSSMVTISSDGWTLQSSNWQLSLDGQGRFSGYGANPSKYTGWEVGRSDTVPGFFFAVNNTTGGKWPFNSTHILDIQAQQQVRNIYSFRPPAPNWSYAYRQLQAIAQYKQAVVWLLGITAAVGLAILLAPEAAVVLLLLLVISSETMGVEVKQPAAVALRLAEQKVTAAQINVDPVLVNTLRQSYGPLVDSVNLRPMQAEQLSVSASGQNVDMVGGALGITALPVIEFNATGFVPGAKVLVVLDRAGTLIAEQRVIASAVGAVQGSFDLPAEEITRAGTLTMIAIDEQEIDAQLNALPEPTGVEAASNTNALMNVAATKLTVAPAPRLIGSVTFDPLPLVAHRETTATFSVQNVGDVPLPIKHLLLAGRGADCADWCDGKWADWPGVQDITLAPGETYSVSSKRSLVQPGQYRFTVAYQDTQGSWHDADASPRFSAYVEPGIIAGGITISPSLPLAGEVVTARVSLRNDSSTTLSLSSLYLAGKGPDCTDGWLCQDKWADMPSVHGLQLSPGEEYVYYQRRSFPLAGSYFVQPAYQFSKNDWQTAGSRFDFRIGSGIRVVKPLTIQPLIPITGEPVRATYTIRNQGTHSITIPYLGVVARGPDCTGSSWECERYGDWPWIDNVTLAPGQEYTYESMRSFGSAGGGYWAEPQLADWNPWWQLIDGGERVTFAVDPGLVLVEPLTLEPPDPVVGEMVTARAVVQNQSTRVIRLSRLLVGAQGPNCADFGCAGADPLAWGDFPWQADLTLQPNERYQFEASRMWLREGTDYIAQVLYQFGQDDWQSLGTLRKFAVGKGLEFAYGLKISPANPSPGQSYTGTYTLINRGPRKLVIPALGVGGRRRDCDDAVCQNNAGMAAYFDVEIGSGERYTYTASRSIVEEGTYWVEPFALTTQTGWWMSMSPLPMGDRITFTVGSESPPFVLLPCTVTIERGATFTRNQDVTLMINAPGATRMLVSNDGGFIGAVEMPYGTEINWSFPADIGERVATVTVRVRAFNGAERVCGSDLVDDIIFDAVKPTVTASWESNQVSAAQSGTIVGALVVYGDDQEDGSGIVDMQVSERADFPEIAWDPYTTRRQIENSSRVLYVRVRDRAGNVSDVATVNAEPANQLFIPVVRR